LNLKFPNTFNCFLIVLYITIDHRVPN